MIDKSMPFEGEADARSPRPSNGVHEAARNYTGWARARQAQIASSRENCICLFSRQLFSTKQVTGVAGVAQVALGVCVALITLSSLPHGSFVTRQT